MTTISDERLAEIEAALGEDTFAGITRTFDIKVPELRAILQSLRAQGGMRVKPLFDLLVDAYVRGIAWQQENPGGEVGYAGKAAYDYADKITSSLEASPAPVSDTDLIEFLRQHHEKVGVTPALREAYQGYAAKGGVPEPAPVSEEMVERINEQVEHVRLGIACRTPDVKAATIELLNQVTALTAALAAKGGQ